jgi:hypothetical protein
MNWKTTLVLLSLAGAGALLYILGPDLPPALNPGKESTKVADRGTRAALKELDADDIAYLQVRHGDETITLERGPGGTWNMPGQWPTHKAEVRALVDLIAGLHSRFEPEPITAETDLKEYGLDDPAVTVRIRTEKVNHSLQFGEKQGEKGDRFSRPTYLRLDDNEEMVRLEPGLLDQLRHDANYYRQRRLFPSERVAKDTTSNEKVERLDASAVTVRKQKEGEGEPISFEVVKDGDQWELREPTRDRLSPEARNKLLEAVPDLWVEEFLPGRDAISVATTFAPVYEGIGSVATAAFWATKAGFLTRAGLTDPGRTLAVTGPGGKPTTLQIGHVARVRTELKIEPPPPGLPPGVPPTPREVREELRYAKLKDNDQIFLVRGDRLEDVFVALKDLRDDRVVRFQATDARKVVLQHPGQKAVVLEKKKEGSDGNENWRLVEPIQADAEDLNVSDLLNQLADLRATDKDVIDQPDPKYELDKPQATITVTVEEEDEKDKTKKKTRTFTVRIGKHDTQAKKLYVQLEGWPRVNAVGDGLAKLVTQSAVAFRGKRVLDFPEADLTRLDITHGMDKLSFVREDGGWKLTAPAHAGVDAITLGQLTSKLASLEALEYVDDKPAAQDLRMKYGLARPDVTATLTLEDGKSRTLELGKARGKEPGFYARLADPERPAVFAVDSDVRNLLTRDSLAYLPLEIWQLFPGDLTALAVARKGESEYRLARKGPDWRIAAPFDAPAMKDVVQKMTDELTALRADSYKTHEARDLTAFGLNEPKLTATLTTNDGKKHTLLVGKETAEGAATRFAKRADNPAVFVIGPAVVTVTDKGALDLLDRTLLQVEPDAIERIVSKSGDQSLTLQRKDKVWEVLGAPGSPFPADGQAAAALTNVWFYLTAERFADYGPKVDWAKYGLNKPAVTVTARVGKGDKPTEHTIAVGKEVENGAGARYARVDNGSGVAVLLPYTGEVLTRTYLALVDHTLLTFDPDEVAALQRQMGGQELRVVKGDGWRLTKPKEEEADRQAMQELMADLSRLRAAKVVAYPAKEAKDLAPFGLDKPEAVVTVQLAGDKGKRTLKVGKVADPATGERYVLAGDGLAVGVVPGDLAGQLTAGPLAFRDRRVARFPDADRVTLRRGPRQAVFSREDGTWKIVEPVKGPASQEGLEELINSLARLRADALVAEKPDAEALKKYGLDRPEIALVFESFGEEVLHLVVGKQEEKGPRRYARLAKGNLVFLLGAKVSGRVAGEFRPRDVWKTPLDALAIETLRFGYPEAPFTLVKGLDGNWQVADKPKDELSKEAVNETLSTLAGLKLERYAIDKGGDLKLFGLEKPALVLQITTGTGQRALQLGNNVGESKARYARLPDAEGVFVLDEATTTKLFRRVKDFAAKAKPPTKKP